MTSGSPRDISDLITEYINAASIHGKGTREGDRDLTKRGHDRLSRAFRELCEHGQTAQQALLPLLEHADPAVRLWASAHALTFAPDRAHRVLSTLAAGPPSPEQLGAKYTLLEWDKGTLKFP